jgi:hypothetical protein
VSVSRINNKNTSFFTFERMCKAFMDLLKTKDISMYLKLALEYQVSIRIFHTEVLLVFTMLLLSVFFKWNLEQIYLF